MKYLSEYRDPEMVQEYLKEIHHITTKPWTRWKCVADKHMV